MSSRHDKQWVIDNLIGALHLMASSPDAQIAALPPFVAIPDEIALLFEDAYIVLEDDLLPVSVRDPLRQILARLEVMKEGPRARFWTTDALAKAPEWERLRADATAALDAWGIAPAEVTIDATNYITGPGVRP